MEQDTLAVIWTSGDIDVAKKMVYMYTYNSKIRGWWKNVILVIWGPSSKLLSENEELQAELQKFFEAGIEVKACKACADMYGVSEKLESLGVNVEYMGEPLTEYLKKDYKILTF